MHTHFAIKRTLLPVTVYVTFLAFTTLYVRRADEARIDSTDLHLKHAHAPSPFWAFFLSLASSQASTCLVSYSPRALRSLGKVLPSKRSASVYSPGCGVLSPQLRTYIKARNACPCSRIYRAAAFHHVTSLPCIQAYTLSARVVARFLLIALYTVAFPDQCAQQPVSA